MPPHWRPNKKSEWNMGTYETTEFDHKAMNWCINNGIKIAPFAKATRFMVYRYNSKW